MKHEIICPFCNNIETIEVYDIIRPGDRAMAEIMNCHISFYKCFECGEFMPIVHNFIYLDEKNKVLIAHKNNPQKDLDLSDYGEYKIRITQNIYEMREKIIVLNQGLNDKIVELLKLVYEFRIEENIMIDWVERLYIEENDGIYVTAILGGGTKKMALLNQDIYEKLEDLYSCHLEDNGERIIDRTWAINIIDDICE